METDAARLTRTGIAFEMPMEFDKSIDCNADTWLDNADESDNTVVMRASVALTMD